MANNKLRQRDPDKYRKMREDGITHLKCVCYLYETHVKAGRYVVVHQTRDEV